MDVKGWKSTGGGFSAIMRVSTDDNNQGGFFVRKVAGAAAAGVHLQKMVPLLVHPVGAQWVLGHFRPMFKIALFGNLAIAAFYGLYLDDLKAADAAEIPLMMLALLAVESLTIFFYLVTSSKLSKKGHAIAMTGGKTPKSNVSNIVTKTIAVVSGAMSIIALRDLIFPGFIMIFVPHDDIYLEWTNAFLHSPPEGSPEAIDNGLEAPLFIGDKFMSQFMALHILILCMYKFSSAFFIRYESDGSGEIKCKMIWKTQAVVAAMILFIFRMFQPSAHTASLDLRWHLMCLGYETFILGTLSVWNRKQYLDAHHDRSCL
jgi:hypothetical protein